MLQVTIEIPNIFLEAVLFLAITYPAINYYWSVYKVFWYFYTMFCTLLQLLWHSACFIDPKSRSGFHTGKFMVHNVQSVLRVPHTWTSKSILSLLYPSSELTVLVRHFYSGLSVKFHKMHDNEATVLNHLQYSCFHGASLTFSKS